MLSSTWQQVQQKCYQVKIQQSLTWNYFRSTGRKVVFLEGVLENLLSYSYNNQIKNKSTRRSQSSSERHANVM